MVRRLTKQERQFVAIKAETGNGALAAREAFEIEDPNYAAVKASRLLRKDNIKEAIADVLSDELLLQVHLEGLAATKMSGTGGMKIGLNTDGEVEDMGHTDIAMPDFAVRHKYLDTAYKLRGDYAPEKHVNLNVDATVSDKVKKLADHLNANSRGGI